MARIAIVPVVSDRDGTALTPEVNGDPAENHYVQNSGRTKLLIRNSNGAAQARTVTIRLSRTVDGQTVASKTKAIAAGATEVFGPYPQDDYGTQLLIDVDNAELKLRAIE
jgi:hypothetical protein